MHMQAGRHKYTRVCACARVYIEFPQAAAAIVAPTIIWVLTFKQENVIIYM